MKILSSQRYKELKLAEQAWHDVQFLQKLMPEKAAVALHLLQKSHAQVRQDLFVLAELDFKKNGFFVEFGATNGVSLSNTFLLEKEFGWQGILAEPARCWTDTLRSNRKAYIENRCVWKQTGETLSFNEANSPQLSTLDIFSNSDFHSKRRNKGKKYQVETISLLDMLSKFNAPEKIDYLSIDTEGSEFEILDAFDFDKYNIKIITCEHNFTESREKIKSLLESKGYVRKLESVSKMDDWYVRI